MRTVMRCVPAGRPKLSTSFDTSSLFGTKTVSPSLVWRRVERQPISRIFPTWLPTSIHSPCRSVRSSWSPRPLNTFAIVLWSASPMTAVSTAEVVTSENTSRPARRRNPMPIATATATSIRSRRIDGRWMRSRGSTRSKTTPRRRCDPRGSRSTSLLEERRAGLRDVLVLLRGVAAHADRADDLAVHRDRHAALERRGAGQGEGGDPSGADLVLELLAGPAEDRRRAGLPDADLDARHLRVVEAVEHDEMAPVVHHRDDDGRTSPGRLRLGGGRDLHGRIQGEDLLHPELIGRAERGAPEHDGGCDESGGQGLHGGILLACDSLDAAGLLLDTRLASPGRSCYRCFEWRSRCDCARSCSARPSAPGRSRWRW